MIKKIVSIVMLDWIRVSKTISFGKNPNKGGRPERLSIEIINLNWRCLGAFSKFIDEDRIKECIEFNVIIIAETIKI